MNYIIILFVSASVVTFFLSKKNKKQPIFKLLSIIGSIVTILLIIAKAIFTPDPTQSKIEYITQKDIYFLEQVKAQSPNLDEAIIFYGHNFSDEKKATLANALGPDCRIAEWVSLYGNDYTYAENIDAALESNDSIKNLIFMTDIFRFNDEQEETVLFDNLDSYNIYLRSQSGSLFNAKDQLKFILKPIGNKSQDQSIPIPEAYQAISNN